MSIAIGQTVPANLFIGIEAVGGKITFLNDGILFSSHSINIQTGNTLIPYNQILTINRRNTLGFVPNGISIITKDGNEYKFVVYKRTDIINFLVERIKG